MPDTEERPLVRTCLLPAYVPCLDEVKLNSLYQSCHWSQRIHWIRNYGFSPRTSLQGPWHNPKIFTSSEFYAKHPHFPKHQAQFIILQSLTQAGAFDEALDGVTYVIHTASPVASVKVDVRPFRLLLCSMPHPSARIWREICFSLLFSAL